MFRRIYTHERALDHQAHIVQHDGIDASRYEQSVMGPECPNNHKGSELCIIASSHQSLTTPQRAQQHQSEGA
jgi:hypothetical protein